MSARRDQLELDLGPALEFAPGAPAGTWGTAEPPPEYMRLRLWMEWAKEDGTTLAARVRRHIRDVHQPEVAPSFGPLGKAARY